MYIDHRNPRLRRGFAFVALAAVMGLALVGLTQCRLVDDTVTGVDLKSNTGLNARSDCVRHCNEKYKVCKRAEEALHKGIPLELVIEFRLVRERRWWTDRLSTDLQLRRRLQFHTLSRQYMVLEARPGGPAESFATLDQALAYLGDFSDFAIALTARKQILPDARHLLAVRAYVNIEALPALMRPLAYATPSWYLGTACDTVRCHRE